MKKTCPRCGASFECRHNDIVHCHCTEVSMDTSLRLFLKENYGEKCLCVSCLKKLAAETGKKA